MHLPSRRQHFVGTGSHPDILREVGPVDDLVAVQQKFRRPRNIMPFRTASGMQQVISADGCGIRVGKNGERITRLLRQIERDCWSVHTDRHRTHSRRFEFRQSFFHAS
jgi:hypothetical protein